MVRSGKHRSTPDVEYAVKCVNIARLKEEDVSALRDQVNILLLLRECKHITRVYNHFDQSPQKNLPGHGKDVRGGSCLIRESQRATTMSGRRAQRAGFSTYTVAKGTRVLSTTRDGIRGGAREAK
jgi:hypothetical protein